METKGRSVRACVLAAFAPTIALIACNSLNGTEGLSASDCAKDPTALGCKHVSSETTTGGYEPPTSSGNNNASSSGVTATRDAGTSSGDATANNGKPSYCTGILMYVPWDGDAKTKTGLTPSESGGGADVSFVTAKFGQGAHFSPDEHFMYTASAATPLHSTAAGTIVTWMKPDSSSLALRPVFRPQSVDNQRDNDGDTVAPWLGLGLGGGKAGMQLGAVQAAVNDDTAAGGIRGWNTSEFHLVAGTWNAAPTPGGSTISFFVKNATAETTAATTTAWTPRATTTPFVRLLAETDNVNATVDDTAIWDHELTLEELRAIYTSAASLGATCGL